MDIIGHIIVIVLTVVIPLAIFFAAMLWAAIEDGKENDAVQASIRRQYSLPTNP